MQNSPLHKVSDTIKTISQNVAMNLAERKEEADHQYVLERIQDEYITYDSSPTETTFAECLSEITGHHLYNGSDADYYALTKTIQHSGKEELFIDEYNFLKFQETVYYNKQKYEYKHTSMEEIISNTPDIQDLIKEAKNETTENKIHLVNTWVNAALGYNEQRFLEKSFRRATMSEKDFANYWNQTTAELLTNRQAVCFDTARIKVELLAHLDVPRDQMIILHTQRYDETKKKDTKHTVPLVMNNQTVSVLGYNQPIDPTGYFEHFKPLYACLDDKMIPFVEDYWLQYLQHEQEMLSSNQMTESAPQNPLLEKNNKNHSLLNKIQKAFFG